MDQNFSVIPMKLPLKYSYVEIFAEVGMHILSPCFKLLPKKKNQKSKNIDISDNCTSQNQAAKEPSAPLLG